MTCTGRLLVTTSVSWASAWFVPFRLRRTETSVSGGASEVFAALASERRTTEFSRCTPLVDDVSVRTILERVLHRPAHRDIQRLLACPFGEL